MLSKPISFDFSKSECVSAMLFSDCISRIEQPCCWACNPIASSALLLSLNQVNPRMDDFDVGFLNAVRETFPRNINHNVAHSL